ncbi:helix-turn-helix domain-containing protein [Marinifilum sp. RC60d5]|uniref:helix-turn-helix domain-containing protein n=1 Tax=Marinifilum sp. RC60d5 TaxID=3458414 RepID=UPI004035BA12
MDSVILKKLESIEQMLTEQNMLKKEVINFNEACKYLEFSESHLYKLTSSNLIPHYKPNGKKIYFNRKELDTWLLRNRISSKDEIDQRAADYLVKKGRITL